MPDKQTAILILAAGSASRMGRPKQLLPWGKTTLLGNCITQAKGILAADVFVVLGANYVEIASEIKNTNIEILHHEEWEKGIGSSIAFGVNSIANKNKYQNLLILLADQPFVTQSDLKHLLDLSKKHPKKIIASVYKSKKGVPAVFDACFFEALKCLNEDFGAKKILQQYDNSVVASKKELNLQDIDTLEVYKTLINKGFEK